MAISQQYLYHGHYGMQRAAGLYGSIIVSLPEGVSEPFSYDYDHNIILSDWYHASTNEQAAGLSAIPFVFVGEPQVNSVKSKLRSTLICLELVIKCSNVS
jgi:FtsP/CotA-like multicopper oxidase with cupredoxin domain